MSNSTRSKQLAAYAHGMRCAMTESEATLWRSLRCCQLGVRFRRQEVLLGRYIADFYCPQARLVVEVDGAYHARRRAADARRERKLQRAGYRLLCIDAEQVLRDLPSVLQLIRQALQGAVAGNGLREC